MRRDEIPCKCAAVTYEICSTTKKRAVVPGSAKHSCASLVVLFHATSGLDYQI